MRKTRISSPVKQMIRLYSAALSGEKIKSKQYEKEVHERVFVGFKIFFFQQVTVDMYENSLHYSEDSLDAFRDIDMPGYWRELTRLVSEL